MSDTWQGKYYLFRLRPIPVDVIHASSLMTSIHTILNSISFRSYDQEGMLMDVPQCVILEFSEHSLNDSFIRFWQSISWNSNEKLHCGNVVVNMPYCKYNHHYMTWITACWRCYMHLMTTRPITSAITGQVSYGPFISHSRKINHLATVLHAFIKFQKCGWHSTHGRAHTVENECKDQQPL